MCQKAHGCEVSKEKIIAFVKTKHCANSRLSNAELDVAAGG